MTRIEWSPDTLAVLRAADRALLQAERGDVYALYAAVRVAMQAIAPVDSFYVAWIRTEERTTAMPYTFDRGRAQTTEVLPYGPRGLTSWILASRRTYRFRDDNGALIGMGYDFGGKGQSGDAIVTPILDGGSLEAVGFLAVLSDEPNVFTDEHVAAFEWLATAFEIARTEGAKSPHRAHLLKVYPELDSQSISDPVDLANVVSAELHDMAAALQALSEGLSLDQRENRLFLQRVAGQCLRLGARVSEMRSSNGSASAFWATFTPREREVALLMCGSDGDLTNREIGHRLGMAEATVKTHVARVLRKVGVRQRGELRWALGPTDVPGP